MVSRVGFMQRGRLPAGLVGGAPRAAPRSGGPELLSLRSQRAPRNRHPGNAASPAEEERRILFSDCSKPPTSGLRKVASGGGGQPRGANGKAGASRGCQAQGWYERGGGLARPLPSEDAVRPRQVEKRTRSLSGARRSPGIRVAPVSGRADWRSRRGGAPSPAAQTRRPLPEGRGEGHSARMKTLSRGARVWQPPQTRSPIESAVARRVARRPTRSYQYQVPGPMPGNTFTPTAKPLG